MVGPEFPAETPSAVSLDASVKGELYSGAIASDIPKGVSEYIQVAKGTVPYAKVPGPQALHVHPVKLALLISLQLCRQLQPPRVKREPTRWKMSWRKGCGCQNSLQRYDLSAATHGNDRD